MAVPAGFTINPVPARRDSLGPHTITTLRRLAALEPRTLAVMHGASFTGDGGATLTTLADRYLERLTSSLTTV